MTLENTSESDGQGLCDLFSRYFGSVFDGKTNPYTDQSGAVNNTYFNVLSGFYITVTDIERKIDSLDINKGAGPDLLPPIFIKSCGKELSIPLCVLFNKSLTSGVFPKRWKTAHIISIYKSGDKSYCKNYRPISILSCAAKLFESVMCTHLYSHFKPVLSDKQHGFVRNRSTVTNLLEYKNYLCQVFATGGQVDSVYTDFSKAFDKVNHHLLCHKLASHGIHGSLYRWICSYLDSRTQLVALKGFISAPIAVTSGVPHGSHLGPLFFVVFINDLIQQLSCNCLLYADDLKIFTSITNLDDCFTLQRDINTVSQWCKTNYMYLNIDKCFVISFTNKRNKIVWNYDIDGQLVNRSDVATDLGILFDDKLSFRAHYSHITSKANHLLGFILRSTKGFKNPCSTLYLYFSLVKSILEYGSPIWSPNYNVHIDDIERIQRKFLRILCYRIKPGRSNLNYCDRLLKFKVQPLESRRIIFDLVYLYKITHSIIDSPELLAHISINIKFSARRSSEVNLFSLQIYKNNISYYNPLTRMARQYNEMAKSNHLLVDIFCHNINIFISVIKDILHRRLSADPCGPGCYT
ncbi:unnamed protein product [Pieris macdunnoughi]|uniref:Reverse transcriptase domain-containing protein n=1 Tax=Pieris macdunnoughi TaxID=345717 RepID=A0A821UFL1_9NEOP|nr:unnamed protein product [Pieris macdunnoughi]